MKKIFETAGSILIFIIMIAFFGGVYLGTKYTDNQAGVEILQHKVDSLKDENFVLEVELSRWETTIEWYKEAHPKEAKKLEHWRSHNTE
jgi:hypothetical protein